MSLPRTRVGACTRTHQPSYEGDSFDHHDDDVYIEAPIIHVHSREETTTRSTIIVIPLLLHHPKRCKTFWTAAPAYYTPGGLPRIFVGELTGTWRKAFGTAGLRSHEAALRKPRGERPRSSRSGEEGRKRSRFLEAIGSQTARDALLICCTRCAVVGTTQVAGPRGRLMFCATCGASARALCGASATAGQQFPFL